MAKLQYVSELADQTAQNVTHDVSSWKQYLTTASRLYKYCFEDQLLIYAQRPEATACASMEIWNHRMNRWIKTGSKGIALIHQKESGRPRLTYVFDLADTRPVHNAKLPYLWELRKEHQKPIVDVFEKRYGKGKEEDFIGKIMEVARSASKEIYQEYLHDLAYDIGGSFLEELDKWNLELRFRDTLIASVQYTLLSRCGFDPSDYLEDEQLGGIVEFSNSAVLHHLGDATSSISMELLQEIGKVIRNYDCNFLNWQEKK